MIFGGLQKLTLLDYPGKVACTVFCVGCDFRCPFCHNNGLVTGKADLWTEEEVLGFLAKRHNVLEGVCLTGGEPLIYPDAEEFLRKVKSLGYQVKLDTNGSFPLKLQRIVDSGLADYVAMDVKNCKELYSATAGVQADTNAIAQSVDILKRGKVDFEFRTTVTRTFHTEQSLAEVAMWLKGADKWFLQQFVHGSDLIDPNVKGYTDDQLRDICDKLKAIFPGVQTRGI